MEQRIMNEAAEFVRSKDAKFRYQLLSRMVSDCRYYLGNGRLYGPHLWAADEVGQIAYMKALWHSFPADEKPEWLSLEDILAYERRLDPRYKLQQDALNRIADRLGVIAWYPAYHADPMEKNPVLLYQQETYAHNQELSKDPTFDNFMMFYHQPEQDLFQKPFLLFENTDSSGAMTYDFACDGQVDLRSENCEDALFTHIQQALTAYLQNNDK